MEIKKGQVWECLISYGDWTKGYNYLCKKDGYLYNSKREQDKVSNFAFLKNHFKLIGTTEIEVEQGYKESNEKLEYELDWDFIKQVAERMSTNKGKYSAYNWKKSMDIEKLKQSLFRHVIEVMNGNYQDEEREYGHLEALVCNAMFINYQLKK